MAKIVPGQQYADIQEYDAFDDFLKIFEIAQTAQGVYQKEKESIIGNINTALKSAVDMIPLADNDDTILKLGKQIDNLHQRAYRYGDDLTKINVDVVKSKYKNTQEDFKHFKTTIDKIIEAQTYENSMLNPKMLTEEKIMNWNIDDIRSVYNTLDSYYSQISTPSTGTEQEGIQPGQLKFQGYRVGEHNVSTSKKWLDSSMRKLSMGIRSLQGDGRITEDEAGYIITASDDELETLRGENLTHSENMIKAYAINTSELQDAINSLEIKKDKSLYDIAMDDCLLYTSPSPRD